MIIRKGAKIYMEAHSGKIVVEVEFVPEMGNLFVYDGTEVSSAASCEFDYGYWLCVGRF